MYVSDTEWNPETYEFLCGSIVNEEGLTFIQKGKSYSGPAYIDDICYYFATFRDITLLEPYVKFREYLDLGVLLKIYNNYSINSKIPYIDVIAAHPDCKHKPHPRDDSRLRTICEDLLGYEWRWKDIAFPTYVSAELRNHNKEDARATYKLAKFLLAVIPPADIERANRFQELNAPWKVIAEQPVYYDVEWQNALIQPENLIQRALAKGIDFFVLEDGRIKIKREPFQNWLRDHKIPVPTKISAAPYAKDGLLLSMKWRQMEDLARNARDADTRELCMLVYTIMRAHTAQSGESRFNRNVLHVFEIPCAQSSGRVSHLGCPITAGSLFRMAVVPPKGYKTLSLDIKSQEVVLAALFSKDTALMKACEEDVYSYLAAVFTGNEYVRLDKKDSFRTFVKNIVLPWLYGVSYQSLANTMATPPDYARLVLDRLDRAFPDFWMWKQEIFRQCITQGYADTALHGYRLKIDERKHTLQVINHCIQGTGCDMLRIWCKALVDAGYPPFATLHDGVYIYVPEDFDEQILIDLSEKALNEAIPLDGIPSFKSWTVECASYRKHLMEKGDDYYKLLANLTGKSIEEMKALEE